MNEAIGKKNWESKLFNFRCLVILIDKIPELSMMPCWDVRVKVRLERGTMIDFRYL